MRYAWVEINLSAIKNNIQQIRQLVGPKTRICSVIKANAYGHGAAQIASTLLNNGSNMLGVANLDEALHLRQSGIVADILIIGFTPFEDYRDLIFNNIAQTVYSLEQANELNEIAKNMQRKAKVHIKVDVGMSRIGFCLNETLVEQIVEISQCEYLDVEGIFMHPPMADSDRLDIANEQLQSFLDIIDQLALQHDINDIYVHTSNSAAVIDLQKARLNMIRTGASTYGYYSSDSVSRNVVNLKPALSLKARIIQLKTVPKNTPVGYGASYITSETTQIATIPIGFGDGYWKSLTMASVLIHGVKVPIIGKIAMDMFMVDVSSLQGVKEGDEVVLIGQQGDEHIWADELAKLVDGYEFELLCHLGLRLKKYYIV